MKKSIFYIIGIFVTLLMNCKSPRIIYINGMHKQTDIVKNNTLHNYLNKTEMYKFELFKKEKENYCLIIDSTLFKKPYYTTNLYHNKTLDSLILLFKQKINSKNIDTNIEINWVGTVNFGLRKPNFVIIHHTAQNSCEQTLKTFTNVNTLVSAHYVVCKDGTIYNMLHDYLRAQHAGFSQWGSLTDINSSSIGIELDNDGYTPFDTLQINSLIKLLGYLKKKYNIPTPNFIGHGDIAPTRKNDPNIYFPWKDLAKLGYGNWAEKNDSVEIESNFSVNNALRLIGYNTKDTMAAFMAFKRHFRQDTSRIQTLEDKQVLKQLINLK